ncbi:MAG: LPS export ABC transporter periplasmic protein LptC [Oligoflexales bacterium]
MIFSLLSIAAVLVFLVREERRPSQREGSADVTPMLSLKEFVVYRYLDDQVRWTVSAKLGNFLDPNVVEVFGSVEGSRVVDDETEIVTAESAVAYLDANSLSDSVKDAQISRVEIDSSVNIAMKNYAIKTDYAEYTVKSQTIESDLPVTVEQKANFFEGQNGFNYNLNKDLLTIKGPLKGVVKSSTRGVP